MVILLKISLFDGVFKFSGVDFCICVPQTDNDTKSEIFNSAFCLSLNSIVFQIHSGRLLIHFQFVFIRLQIADQNGIVCTGSKFGKIKCMVQSEI